MPLTLLEGPRADTLHVQASGKLTREDYKEFSPQVEEKIRRHGKIRVLFVMEDFHGWTAGALWEDTKFDLSHFSDIERLALVGEKRWEKMMASFCKPFTKAKIRYFDLADRAEAERWLATGLEGAPGGTPTPEAG